MSTTANVCGMCGVWFPPGTLHQCFPAGLKHDAHHAEAVRDYVEQLEALDRERYQAQAERDALRFQKDALIAERDAWRSAAAKLDAERDEAVRLLRTLIDPNAHLHPFHRGMISDAVAFLNRLDGES